MPIRKPRRESPNGGNGSPPAPAGSAAYFLSLSLKNVRCFGEETQTLDLSDGKGRPARWTVLLGNNGTGKTTILQAMAAFEHQSPEADGFRRLKRLKVLGEFVRSSVEEATLSARFAHGTIASGRTQRNDAEGTSLTVKRGVHFLEAHSFHGEYRFRCHGYGASRRFGPANLVESDNDDPAGSLFSDDAPLRNAEEWLLRLDYSASKPSGVQQRQERHLAAVKEMLVRILPEVEEIRFTTPTAEQPSPRVEFKTPYGWVTLGQLGHGYRTLIAWMVDFASRLFERDPDASNPLHAPAVALVDEIDLHLHPIWQRQVMSYLTECFPNTQFVVTAHSPLIVQAAGEDVNIALLRREGDHVVIDNDVDRIRGWRVDQLLTSDLFGLPSARPPQFDALLERRKALLTKATLTRQDEEELARIEAQIGPLPVGETAEAARANALIEESIRLLKETQATRP